MTCANTIYGVTMQESGVSKQVSVRFEDVSDNGEILADNVPAASTPALPSGEEEAA
jgi:chromosome segregation protein